MLDVSHLHKNLLLAALPPELLEHLLPLVEEVDLKQGHELWNSRTSTGHVYFPTSAVCSLFSGTPGSIAVVGREGVVGVSLLLTDASVLSRTVVHSAGKALRIAARALLAEFERGGEVMRVLLRYLQALVAQMVRTAACNHRHSLDQRLSRQLLVSMDRAQTGHLETPESLVAEMLGTSSASALECVHGWHHAGLVRYEQGIITVLNRSRIEQRACECYLEVRQDYDQRLPQALLAY
jgi:CRP-like cAMP-binding protein